MKRPFGRTDIALTVIAVMMAPAGVQAAFAPRSFFDDFPLGRGWIAVGDAAYDEHLVRDVGALFLALIAVTAWTVWRRQPSGGVALAWLVQGVLHGVYHLGHVDELDTTIDKVGVVLSVVTVPVLAALALWWQRGRADALRRG